MAVFLLSVSFGVLNIGLTSWWLQGAPRDAAHGLLQGRGRGYAGVPYVCPSFLPILMC